MRAVGLAVGIACAAAVGLVPACRREPAEGSATAGAREVVELLEYHEQRPPKGEDLFVRYCAFCHGREGTGEGLNAPNVTPRPANLMEIGARKDLDDEFLFRVIKEGGEKTGLSNNMPPFGHTLKDEEIRFLVEWYIRRLPAPDGPG